MNKTPVFFSIVVPIYNVKQFLDKCVGSILNQSYTDFELILVDDGSTDGSSQMCDQYKKQDSRIIVIHKKNGGLVSARKAGIAVARGDYAVCVDSDDWLDENYLLEVEKIVSKYSTDVVCFEHYEVLNGKTKKRPLQFRKGLYNKSDLQNEIYPSLIRTTTSNAFPPSIWAKVYKMELYRSEQLAVDDRIKIGEDAACTIPCMVRANSVYVLDKPLYYYRRNSSSMTKDRKPFFWEVPELIERHLRERVTETNFEFQRQISRRTVHALINVVKTQFYRKERYSVIVKKIDQELNRTLYQNALKDSDFKLGSPIWFCRFFLVNHIYFPFYLLSKIR